MQLIKLSATDSTNAYLKDLMFNNILGDFTVVMAHSQLKGRGQMGTNWLSEPGKNLTFSVLVKSLDSPVSEQFLLNIYVSLAIYDSLTQLNVPDLKIKWPNDIMSGHSKICGILIENILSGHHIQASIIGIGLNVNQLTFNNLPNVSSLKLLLGKTLDLDELLTSIVENLKKLLGNPSKGGHNRPFELYESRLFRKDKPSTFKNQDDEMFMGFIKGVSSAGKLKILMEDNIMKEFNLKEVQLLY
ncbi:biotin--[acetyl-CoA-carboxylase] ligase [Arenibacter echinorum]|uniref:BirA family biotin operon repressor/biotin-[acetyl-CoA-carboxylase] ligase n=1 Tax=Arenibacter echinorum TaxID=440515 RepID=A0A327QQJ1_9FLAO|nr:biotin--[acetyl-CoA-carboxylase] ligase [Arenibacter echinorum]RAJ06165.1 BirA family biotin operon repressor/biotin-[acetyl-CoA-carboxylase] ligase [Arenibacter echinorum]